VEIPVCASGLLGAAKGGGARPEDVAVLASWHQLYDLAGDEDTGDRAIVKRAVRLDATQVAVAVNLGTYYVQRRRAREAIRLWADALSRNPP